MKKLGKVRETTIKQAKKEAVIDIKKTLSRVFTPTQVDMLLTPSKSKTRWTADDIASAISLRCISPKMYRHLKYSMKLPLPSLSTIRRWVANVPLEPGTLDNVLKIMKYKGNSMTELQKFTILSFDEISLSNLSDIDRRKQKVVGPHKFCQVVMARGLFMKWKQPIFYEYDTPITKEILLDLIKKLYEIKYIVIGVVCDLGPKNKEVFKSLEVGLDDPTKCSFPHPCDSYLEVFSFFDGPHLLKLLRNHFLDDIITIDDKIITKVILEQLLKINSPEINTCHKFQQYHLDVQGPERQKVKPAAQLFSNTVAKNIEYWGQKGHFEGFHWLETAAFIKTVNDWFDLFNNATDFTHAYGKDLNLQNALLLEMSEYMKDMRFGNHKSIIEFQKGILRNNESLQNLLQYLKVKYPVHSIAYILTYRLNQDVLENLFSYIRAMGATNDHPTALDIQRRLRLYILGKFSGILLTSGTNTTAADPTEQNLINMSDSILSECSIYEDSSQSSQEQSYQEDLNEHLDIPEHPEEIFEGAEEQNLVNLSMQRDDESAGISINNN